MAILLLRPKKPALDLRLALTGALPANVTFSRASTATYFDKNGLLQTASSGAARFTYDPATLTPLGLLIEESRTNLALQSNAFSTTWVTVTDGAVASAAGISPDGTSNAWKLSESTTTSAAHQTSQTVTKAASSLAYVGTVFAKAVERTRISIKLISGSNGIGAAFDLAGGQVNTPDVAGTGFTSGGASIQNVGGGWYRCSLAVTSDTTTALGFALLTDNGSGTATRSTTYAGTIGSGVLIYGAQLEQAAFPTSYIPTTTASVTRAADVATMTLANIGIPANPTGLTIIGKARTAAGVAAAANEWPLSLTDGTTNNRVGVLRSASGGDKLLAFASSGGVGQQNTAIYTSPPSGADVGFWLAEAANDFAAQVIGQTKVTSGTNAMPTGLTTLNLGALNGGQFWNSTIARLQLYYLYNRRLPDAQAAAIAAAL